MATYKVLVGINYRIKLTEPEIRKEPGELVDDLPTKVAKAYLEIGAIEKTSRQKDS